MVGLRGHPQSNVRVASVRGTGAIIVIDPTGIIRLIKVQMPGSVPLMRTDGRFRRVGESIGRKAH